MFLEEFSDYLIILFCYGEILSLIFSFFSLGKNFNYIKKILIYSLISFFSVLGLCLFASPLNPVDENTKLVFSPIFFIAMNFTLFAFIFGVVLKEKINFIKPSFFNLLFSLPLISFTVFVFALGSSWKN